MADYNTDIQLTRKGRITAGILLVTFTVFSIIIIMAFWPDRLPKPGSDCTLYKYDWFDMALDTNACKQPIRDTATEEPARPPAISQAPDTGSLANGDTLIPKDTAPPRAATSGIQEPPQSPTKGHIQLNIILLMLVVAGGFLGNMIHIATSFTTFVGAGKFQRSWILWYWVRPFTASALALALYFAFGASKDPSHVDLDRILTLAILAGLFTDIATQKLKEVFDVLFNPKDNRPNKLNDPVISITGITPDELASQGENKITITGENLKNQALIITVDGEPITDAQVTNEAITFTYTIPEASKEKTELVLQVTDPAGNTRHKETLPVTENAAPPPPEGTEDAEEKAVG